MKNKQFISEGFQGGKIPKSPTSDIAENIARNFSMKVDMYVKLRIQPKPWWLPEIIWHKILQRLLVLEYFKSNDKAEEM